jgi:hypothetical protein
MAIPLLFLKEEKLRPLISLSVFLMLFPTGLGAQSASPGADLPVQGVAFETGGQPLAGERTGSALSLPTDMKWTGLTPAASQWPDLPGLSAVRARNEKSGESAYIKAAPPSGRRRDTTHDRVALILLSLAVHAAVTWDAQSTNHFFHHYPEGYRPTEVDPLMRPFAGNVSMYPMANLLFAAPFDLLLLKTRHSQKPIRILTYAAASVWVGLEIHQSIVNMGNEHINSSR